MDCLFPCGLNTSYTFLPARPALSRPMGRATKPDSNGIHFCSKCRQCGPSVAQSHTLVGPNGDAFRCDYNDQVTAVKLNTANLDTAKRSVGSEKEAESGGRSSLLTQTKRSCSHGRQHASGYFAEANPIAVALALPGNGEFVAVFEPFARFAIWQL